MKLHFSKNWLRQDESRDPDPQMTVGPASSVSDILDSNDRYGIHSRWQEFPLRDMTDIGWIQATAREIRESQRELVARLKLMHRSVLAFEPASVAGAKVDERQMFRVAR